MPKNSRRPGRHFLHIPGPSPVPDRILRAIDRPTIDHRGPDFAELGHLCLKGMQALFNCKGPVIIYPASGTGAWEAALVNTLSPGDTVLMVETGHFATLWRAMANRLGLRIQMIETDWRTGATADQVGESLRNDTDRTIKAVCVVHNETSTGCLSPIDQIGAAIAESGHPALFMVDTISSLGSTEYRHDDWGVDVTIGASQKGLMLPPGLSFNALSERAIEASGSAALPSSFWCWEDMLGPNRSGYFPYTPSTNLLYGLAEAIALLKEEGFENVFARHRRHAQASRIAARAWGLDILCKVEEHHSPVLTAVLVPDGFDADRVREVALNEFDLSLGTGLGRVAKKVFRIGHLGDVNDLTIIAALSGIEMSLEIAGITPAKSGVKAAMDYLMAELASASPGDPEARLRTTA